MKHGTSVDFVKSSLVLNFLFVNDFEIKEYDDQDGYDAWVFSSDEEKNEKLFCIKSLKLDN